MQGIDSFKFGSIITEIIGAMGSCFDFLDSVTIEFGGFSFSLLDFLVAFIVLFLILSFIFPWFGEEEE